MDEPIHPVPLELRVHGVGGPQAVKMLGELHEEDVVTMPSFLVQPDRDGRQSRPSFRLPSNGETRFAQRLAGVRTEAYEWGGLTTGSALKALWILYLPFTLINAGGWAHAADRPVTPGGPRRTTRRSVRWHLWLTHVAAYLATLTYVAWLGYLTLDVVAVDWVGYVQQHKKAEGVLKDVILLWTPRLAPVVCVLAVLCLLLCPVRKGRFEEVRGSDRDEDHDAPWPRLASVAEPGFFTHKRSHDRRLLAHWLVAFVGLTAAVLQFMVGWNRLGLALLAVAAIQVVVLGALCVVDITGRGRRLPSEVYAETLITDPHLRNTASRVPAGAAFVALGTALAHSAFAGLAMTLTPLLARWPEGQGQRPEGDQEKAEMAFPAGAELRASDVLAWALVLFVGLTLVVLLCSRKTETEVNLAGEAAQGPVVRLTRQASMLGLAALLAMAIPVAVYLVLNVRGIFDTDGSGFERVRCWYDRYDVSEDAVARRLGGFLLLLLPGAVYAALLRKQESGFSRVVGNVWDVLTFWPRRFHPYGAPCSAERSVPELRSRIVYVLERLSDADRRGLVIVGHSQGSVIAAAAIASLPAAAAPPSLVTFGSPLGTLFAPTWPAYIPPLLHTVGQRVDHAHPNMPWVNFWRYTDPVGAEVPVADNRRLEEPQAPSVADFEVILRLPPLERPSQWGTIAGHGRYLAEPSVQDAIKQRRADRNPA